MPSSAAQYPEPFFESLLEPLVPPEMPFEDLHWDMLPDVPGMEDLFGSEAAVSAPDGLIPAWHGIRDSADSSNEFGRAANQASSLRQQQQEERTPAGEAFDSNSPIVSMESDLEALWRPPTSSTALGTKTGFLPGLSAHPKGTSGEKCNQDVDIHGYANEAHILEDLYLNAPGFTSMLEELASTDNMASGPAGGI